MRRYWKIYENSKKIEFYVVDKVKPKVITGMPFLKAFDIYLSFHKSLLEFNTQSVYLYDIKNLLNDYKVIFMKDSCLLYTSPSPRDGLLSRMPSSA